jgi:hypothetical protein
VALPHDYAPMGSIWADVGIRCDAVDKFIQHSIALSSLSPHLVAHVNSACRQYCHFHAHQSNLSLQPNYTRLRIRPQRFRTRDTCVSPDLFVPAVHIRTIYRQHIIDCKYCDLTNHSSGQPPRNMSKLMLSRPAAA